MFPVQYRIASICDEILDHLTRHALNQSPNPNPSSGDLFSAAGQIHEPTCVGGTNKKTTYCMRRGDRRRIQIREIHRLGLRVHLIHVWSGERKQTSQRSNWAPVRLVQPSAERVQCCFELEISEAWQGVVGDHAEIEKEESAYRSGSVADSMCALSTAEVWKACLICIQITIQPRVRLCV